LFVKFNLSSVYIIAINLSSENYNFLHHYQANN
jgi:hypothetical protein